MPISKNSRGWCLLLPLIPSILVTIFNLYHFLRSRTLRIALNNHVIILLLTFALIGNLTNIIWHIYFYFHGQVLSLTLAFCQAWTMIGTSTYIIVVALMAWASVERHILIFYRSLLSTKVKRVYSHYLPLIVCILWPITFYFVAVFVLSCNIPLTTSVRFCAVHYCYLSIPWASSLDSIANYAAPTFITVIFSVTLFVRVIYHRYHARRDVQWRNYRKMALQLLPLSVLCIVIQAPPILLYTAYSVGLSWNTAADYYTDAFFFTYWLQLLIPFACTFSLPDLTKKCKAVLFFWRQNPQIVPQASMLSRPNMNSRRIVPQIS